MKNSDERRVTSAQFFRAAFDVAFFFACMAVYLTASFGVVIAMILLGAWRRLFPFRDPTSALRAR